MTESGHCFVLSCSGVVLGLARNVLVLENVQIELSFV